jgi:nickel-dependent lactate racemase
MPEIWLKYGTTDVVLNIKLENLLSHILSTLPIISDDELRITLNDDVYLKDDTLLFALSNSDSTLKIADMLLGLARQKGLSNVTVGVLPQKKASFRSYIPSPMTTASEIKDKLFQEKINAHSNIMFISQTTYDPLFGYGGTPTILLRNYLKQGMTDAFNARQSNLPMPGLMASPLKIALQACESLSAKSIELIANSSGIIGMHHGTIFDAFEASTTQLNAYVTETEMPKYAIINTGNGAGQYSTLADSLNSLWNAIHIIRQGGSAVLVGENIRGIGSAALEMFIEGRLNLEQQKQNSTYIEGFEHLVYLDELRQQYDLSIVSTLPHYYLKAKLGLKTYTNMKSALEGAVSKFGTRQKVMVISDADIVLLKAKE